MIFIFYWAVYLDSQQAKNKMVLYFTNRTIKKETKEKNVVNTFVFSKISKTKQNKKLFYIKTVSEIISWIFLSHLNCCFLF